MFVVSRIFDAPRATVFQAYIDPHLIPRWWGPKRLRTVVDRMEVHTGGRWRFIQQDVAGNTHAFSGQYREIAPPSRLVLTFRFEGLSDEVLEETVTFEDLDGRTRVSDAVLFPSAQRCAAMVREGMKEGVTEELDRLADLLASLREAPAADTA